jgi:hypothetical protein
LFTSSQLKEIKEGDVCTASTLLKAKENVLGKHSRYIDIVMQEDDQSGSVHMG